MPQEDAAMKRLVLCMVTLVVLAGFCGPALAASQKALGLRQANGLTAFTPPEKFLSGNFVGDEMNPAFVFGPVQAFVKTLKCPVTWLRETQPGMEGSQEKYGENTVYLEEDCPGKVRYYVFVDQSGLTPQQWYEWRQKFHKSKTQEQYSVAQSKLEQACQAGCGFTAELRYIEINGELLTSITPEAYLRKNLKFAPLYDLNLQKKLTREK
jgi:hypothetical protein